MAESVTTTSISQPWSGIQPYLTGTPQGVLPAAYNVFAQGGPQVYMGPRVAEFSPGQQQAINALYGMASYNPALTAAYDYYGRSVGGQFLQPQSNPYLSGMYQTAAEDVANQFAQQLGGITTRFGQSGRTGSTGMQNAVSGAYGALGKSLGSLAQNIYGQAYESERGRQQQMAQFAPALLQAESGLYGNALSAGGMQTAQQQALLKAAQERFNEQQRRPYENVTWYGQQINPYVQAGGSRTATGPADQREETPWWQTALGVAGSLFSLFSDEKLKKNIKKIGEMDNGLPLYRFHYNWEDDSSTPHIGVMAQEAAKTNPDAVGNVGGYMTVDYGRL